MRGVDISLACSLVNTGCYIHAHHQASSVGNDNSIVDKKRNKILSMVLISLGAKCLIYIDGAKTSENAQMCLPTKLSSHPLR